MKWLGILMLGLFFALMTYAEGGLPDRGDPNAPASVYVSPYYIEHTVEETETPNAVTSVVVDYRGYDTLGETTVILTAGLACLLVLMKRG